MLKQLLTRHFKSIAILVALVISLLIPVFLRSPYHLDILITIIVRAVLAMTFIMLLRSGMINLGIAAFWGVGAYTSTILVMKMHLSFWLSLPASALITGIIALGFGFILIGSGSSGFGFVILSSIIGMLFSVVVGSIPYLGGYNGISNISPPDPIHLPLLPVIEFSVTDKAPFYYLALFLFVIIVLIFRAFYSSGIGRAWTAVALNPSLAESIGVNIFRYKMLSFVLASAMTGLIGSFFAHYEAFVTPNAYGMWMNIYLQMYAMLGGVGFAILGPLVGACIMTVVPELLRMTILIAPIFTGTLLILLVLFLPNGILGIWEWRKEVLDWLDRTRKAAVSTLSIKHRTG